MKKPRAIRLCAAALSVGLAFSNGSMAASGSGPYKFVFFTNTLNNTYQSTMADTLNVSRPNTAIPTRSSTPTMTSANK